MEEVLREKVSKLRSGEWVGRRGESVAGRRQSTCKGPGVGEKSREDFWRNCEHDGAGGARQGLRVESLAGAQGLPGCARPLPEVRNVMAGLAGPVKGARSYLRGNGDSLKGFKQERYRM